MTLKVFWVYMDPGGSAAKTSGEITRLLRAWRGGDPAALERLVQAVYAELRRRAHGYMRDQPAGHTLQTTALVNEAYLHLVDAAGVNWQDRAHFFAVCAQMMRRILVDSARTRGAGKRGGGLQRVDLENVADLSPGRDREIVAIDDALKLLAEMDPRKARVIELRFFGGLSVEETAEALHISPQSVMRDWKLAKAWLTREMSGAANT
jgi:RNA polymerase sigma factor (TIGR02999 family)